MTDQPKDDYKFRIFSIEYDSNENYLLEVSDDNKDDSVTGELIFAKNFFGKIKNIIKLGKAKITGNTLDGGILEKEVTTFVSNMQKVFSQIDTTNSNYDVESISVNAEVSAGGEIGLWGTGVNLTGTGGITFNFKKKGEQHKGIS